MTISTSALMHFTGSKEILQKIISEGFKVNLCPEQIQAPVTGAFIQVVPMVCFCDIPLSQIKEHIRKYGNYGIGLSKAWAIKKKLNPVLYVDKNSTLTDNLRFGFIHQFKQFGTGVINWKDIDDNLKKLFDVIRYLKNYEADLIRNGTTTGNYRFYDEREWRYVPDIDICENMFYSLSDYNTMEKKMAVIQKIEQLYLSFEISDINYIILKSEQEILEFSKWLKNKFNDKISEAELLILISRIITIERIMNDF